MTTQAYDPRYLQLWTRPDYYRELTQVREERDELRKALLDALTEICPATQFRKRYAALIERAQREHGE